MQIGFIGLGKMGSRMVLKLIGEGHEVVVWNRSSVSTEELKLKIQSEKFKIAQTIEQMVQSLEKPRVIWSMVTAGDATQAVMDELLSACSKDDIVIDGGNSHFRDTQNRFEEFGKKGIRFLGIGVSGGILAGENGYPLMVGGDKSAYEHVKPILDSLASPNGGHEYFGVGGAGHFVKMVHNGIEYGIMQSIGEGFGVLQKSAYNLDLLKVSQLYQKGTLVSGFMMDRTSEVLNSDPLLSDVAGVIEESGEAKWTVEEAEEEKVRVPIIKGSLEFRRQSQTDSEVQNSFAAKLIAALRNAFGGHALHRTVEGDEVKKK